MILPTFLEMIQIFIFLSTMQWNKKSLVADTSAKNVIPDSFQHLIKLNVYDNLNQVQCDKKDYFLINMHTEFI